MNELMLDELDIVETMLRRESKQWSRMTMERAKHGIVPLKIRERKRVDKIRTKHVRTARANSESRRQFVPTYQPTMEDLWFARYTRETKYEFSLDMETPEPDRTKEVWWEYYSPYYDRPNPSMERDQKWSEYSWLGVRQEFFYGEYGDRYDSFDLWDSYDVYSDWNEGYIEEWDPYGPVDDIDDEVLTRADDSSWNVAENNEPGWEEEPEPESVDEDDIVEELYGPSRAERRREEKHFTNVTIRRKNQSRKSPGHSNRRDRR